MTVLTGFHCTFDPLPFHVFSQVSEGLRLGLTPKDKEQRLNFVMWPERKDHGRNLIPRKKTRLPKGKISDKSIVIDIKNHKCSYKIRGKMLSVCG